MLAACDGMFVEGPFLGRRATVADDGVAAATVTASFSRQVPCGSPIVRAPLHCAPSAIRQTLDDRSATRARRTREWRSVSRGIGPERARGRSEEGPSPDVERTDPFGPDHDRRRTGRRETPLRHDRMSIAGVDGVTRNRRNPDDRQVARPDGDAQGPPPAGSGRSQSALRRSARGRHRSPSARSWPCRRGSSEAPPIVSPTPSPVRKTGEWAAAVPFLGPSAVHRDRSRVAAAGVGPIRRGSRI
jgi:hypothetical protein